MVQILPQEPSLGALLGMGVGQGVQQKMEESRKTGELQSILGMGKTAQAGGAQQQAQQIPFTQEQILAASTVNPDVASAMSHSNDQFLKQQKMQQQEKQFLSNQEFEREKSSAKELSGMQENLENLENEEMRFARMSELFSPENEEKFPSGFTTALFSKDGELRPMAFSQLSTEAQETVKLTIDELTGAKDTFGARITNFDVQTYLKKLPSLLNSPEGRRQVLRDLRLINKINRLHDEEVLKIVDEAGGAGKISLNKANAIFRKKFKDQIQDLREQFINPEKKLFNELPDASLYPGRPAIDESTGQNFRSDGKKWIPE